ncbi:MAG: response regulator transcription factor [Woeseiaceae bacterium]
MSLVLLISDCESEIEHIRDLITLIGFDVDVVESPSDAGVFCQLRRPHAVVADIEMQGGSGFEAISAVRSASKDCFVIATTRGRHEDMWPIVGEVCGANAYVAGRLTREKILSALPPDGNPLILH